MSGGLSLDQLARPHAGIVTRSQLRLAGWSSSRIDRSTDRGMLIPVARGVYRVAGAPLSRRAARFAALAIAGDRAVLAGWSAAEVHGFSEARPGPFRALVPHGTSARNSDTSLVRVSRTRRLAPDETNRIDGIPVTDAARTLLDLARFTTFEALTELAAAALRQRVASVGEISAAIEAHPGARGRGRLRSVLGLLSDDAGDTRSDVEVITLLALVDAGLPRPVLAHRVVDDAGRFLAEVDLAYPDRRIAIEIDGFRWHSSPARKRADEQRQNQLVLAGWTVLRFSAADVHRRPAEVVDAVRMALDARVAPA